MQGWRAEWVLSATFWDERANFGLWIWDARDCSGSGDQGLCFHLSTQRPILKCWVPHVHGETILDVKDAILTVFSMRNKSTIMFGQALVAQTIV